MASGKQRCHVQKYVHRQNDPAVNTNEGATEANRGSHDDLKVYPSDSNAVRRGNLTKPNDQILKQPAQVNMEPDIERHQPSLHREADGQARFWDTDTESIGKTSNTVSMNEKVDNATEQDEYDENSSEMDGDQHPDGEESEHEETKQRSNTLDQQLRSGEIQLPTGMGHFYQKGDSYPSTTSGNPSKSTSRNGGDVVNATSHPSIHGVERNIPNRQPPQRHNLHVLSNEKSQGHAITSRSHAVPPPARGAFVSRPNPSDHHSMQEEINAGFAFGKAHQAQTNASESGRNQQQLNSIHASAAAPSTNTAQPSLSAAGAQISHHNIPGQQRHLMEIRKNAALPHNLQSSGESRVKYANPALNIVPRFSDDETAEHEQVFGRNEPAEEPQSEVDYDIAQLHEMDYRALKKEPFDINPNSKDLHTEAIGQDDSFSHGIEAVQKSQPKAQAQFFSSLTINEWEHAGDWFLEQFSTAFSQLKNVRQQRRQAARDFEDEIDSRYKAVGQKRKQIDMALAGMKESGGKVLQSTPKKPKTK